MIKKLLALMLTLCIAAGCLTVVALAAGEDDGLILIFEENFEEYQKDVNASSTLMPNFFVCDANSIGDGVISVQETNTGNLYLWSHVFSQVYSSTPIVGAYDFSLDIHEAQGKAQTGVFIRAPKTAAAFYEGDGHPDTSVCQGGLFIYTYSSSIGVNVKTYDPAASGTAYLQNNTVTFNLPQGTAYPYNLRFVDSGSEIAIYVNGTLICRVTYANPGQVYDRHESEGKFFGTAKLYDAEGNEKGSYTNPLMSSDASYIGWTTRAANMGVDNVVVKVEAAYRTLLAINKLPTKVTDKNVEDAKELAEEARALYDALPEEKKALVVNYQKLTKAEDAITAIENVTEAPTEAPTEPVETPTAEITEDVTDAPVDETTAEDITAPAEDTAEAPTEAPAEDTTVTDEDSAEVQIIDDALWMWILAAIMIVAVFGAAAYITVETRK